MMAFLDTVGLLAIWDKSDQWHRAATVCFSDILSARIPVVTTTFVLLECGNAAARKPYRGAVVRLRQQLEATNRLITPTPEDWNEAWQYFAAGQSDSPGIVDHVSFVIMRRLNIKKAFTNDNHFRAAGFETLF